MIKLKKVDLPDASVEAHIIDELNQRTVKQEQNGLMMPTYHDREPLYESSQTPDDYQSVIIIEL